MSQFGKRPRFLGRKTEQKLTFYLYYRRKQKKGRG